MDLLEVRDLSKAFRLDAYGGDSLFRCLKGAFQKNGSPRLHWALRDINFTVKKGEIFGIVGANGAGKTTLLKIVSGILKSTKGRVVAGGPLSAFMELGAAFHPDLDTRQNMYLCGAYFGLARQAIDQKFDEIIQFADLGESIPGKLRSYSAGMIERLTLALATQMKSAILVMDDIFNLGDLRFRDKYLRFFEAFRKEGGAIVLASHHLELLGGFCQRGLYLDRGGQVIVGDIKSVIEEYKSTQQEQGR